MVDPGEAGIVHRNSEGAPGLILDLDGVGQHQAQHSLLQDGVVWSNSGSIPNGVVWSVSHRPGEKHSPGAVANSEVVVVVNELLAVG